MSKKSTPGDGSHGLGSKGFGFLAPASGILTFAVSIVRAVRTSRTA